MSDYITAFLTIIALVAVAGFASEPHEFQSACSVEIGPLKIC